MIAIQLLMIAKEHVYHPGMRERPTPMQFIGLIVHHISSGWLVCESGGVPYRSLHCSAG